MATFHKMKAKITAGLLRLLLVVSTIRSG